MDIRQAGRLPYNSLCQDSLHHLAVDVGEAVVAALEAVGELLVVEAEEVEDGGLEVVDVDGVLGRTESEFVAFAVHLAALHATAGQEHRIAVGEVVAAEDLATGGAALAEGGTAEFAAPDHEGVLEESTLPEVADEGGHRLVHGGALFGESVADVLLGIGSVEIPAPVEELHEANALFKQSPGKEAVIGEAGAAHGGAV